MPFHNHTRPPLHRMLQIHENLKRKEPANCTTLGKALEVSTKTIWRDLTFMRDQLDLPLDYDEATKLWSYTKDVATFPTIQATEGELFGRPIGRAHTAVACSKA